DFIRLQFCRLLYCFRERRGLTDDFNILTSAQQSPHCLTLRIPDDADQCSGLMPITHSERCRSVIPGDADHLFRGDPDAPERFPQGEVTLDITEDKMFLRRDVRERQ